MCEQTEINYLEGDIVWVKLGACWWPGEVTSFHNLPDDIQTELRKKPLIAAVKFFQEDTYEYVKNLHQIYKYNCTQKDEFIKKGLDKYRTKSKDGSSYMDKFPGDVEMAEKLTGGNPDILTSEKFSREQKPDISSLFGEKKIPKKKRDRDEMQMRRSEGGVGGSPRKITHPRFLRESDHEIRIRQQPTTSSLPNTPKTPSSDSPQFSCHLCNFTSSRVNVIICHTKSHRSGSFESPVARPRITNISPLKSVGRPSTGETQKRKYVKKPKTNQSIKSKIERENEPIKRKYTKQSDKSTPTTKKKKTDPELREKLLADWDDESDVDMDIDAIKTVDNSIGSQSTKINDSNQSIDRSDSNDEKIDDIDDGAEILKASEKLLRDTEKFTSLLSVETPSRDDRNTNNKNVEDIEESNVNPPKYERSSLTHKKQKKLIAIEDEKLKTNEKDDKQSRLSCFDFDEDDLPEPTITPVRKIPRIFGEKNTSVKKEILKKFTMSQALKDEETERKQQNFSPKEDEKKDINDEKKDINHEKKIKELIKETVERCADNSAKEEREEIVDEKIKFNESTSSDDPDIDSNSKGNTTETVEIVEIFEVEAEKDEIDDIVSEKTLINFSQTEIVPSIDKINEIIEQPMETEVAVSKDEKIETNHDISGTESQITLPEKEEIISEIVTTETEDETISELADSLKGQSENSDTDGNFTQTNWSGASKIPDKKSEVVEEIVAKVAPRRRGRPKKSINVATEASGNGDDSSKIVNIKPKDPTSALRDSECKTSESDSDRSYTGRRRKPNKRYLHSEIYTRSPDNRASRTDESQSETDEKLQKESKGKLKKGRKSAKVIETVVETVEKPKDQEFEFSSPNVDSSIVIDEPNVSKVTDNEKTIEEKKSDISEADNESNVSSLLDYPKKLETIGSPVNITKFLSGDVENTSKPNKETKEIDTNEKIVKISEKIEVSEVTKNVTKFDKLPPKKSQIKKFELSQIDLLEACSVHVAAESAAEKLLEFPEDTEMEISTAGLNIDAVIGVVPEKEEKIEIPKEVVEKNETAYDTDEAADISEKSETIEMVEAELARLTSDTIVSVDKNDAIPVASESKKLEDDKIETPVKKEKNPIIERVVDLKKSEIINKKQTFRVETTFKGLKKPIDEDIPNSYQEAFIKAIGVDKPEEKIKETEILSPKPKEPEIPSEKLPIDEKITTNVNFIGENVAQSSQIVPTLNAMTEFEGVEILVQENIAVEPKVETTNASEIDLASSLSETHNKLKVSDTLSLDLQKIEDTLTDGGSTASPTSDICVPVKKREKPRIIESVMLTEPMQILKSKLLEKLPSKTSKHKLETSEASKKNESKGGPRAKVMKIDTNTPKSSKSSGKTNFTVSRKLQALKAEEAAFLAAEKEQQEKTQINVNQTIRHPIDGEKFIQQSSQSLADMELDINSMPFVLSEDVLTPESIEQMPLVISSIIPQSTTLNPTIVPSTSNPPSTNASVTPTSQLVAATIAQTATTETIPTSGKKKSGTPAILKSKNKGKPTITSIKTLVPSLTGGVKGIKFQNPQSGKAMPMMSQKNTPGKYVIVQTGGQQVRYSVQGKPGMSQKIAIPAGKSTGNAQIVQQGGKVVILTSAQSGQTKMLPLNISKAMGGKVQKIVNNQGQMYTPISPQGVIGTKTIIAPKTDANSPTTSKVTQGQKLITPQGIITSKGVLTPMSTAKTGMMGALSQGIITKSGIFTPISSAQLVGKPIISGKNIVNKAGTLISSISGAQNLGTSKTVLSPISHTLTGKKILNAQGIVTPKGTLLTPITGQQVKALAAKSPGKTTKVHYQAIQQKLQLPMMQKCQKQPITSGSPTGVPTTVKSPGGTVVFQNTRPLTGQQKVTTPTGKKVVRQIVRSPQTTTTSPQIAQQKGGKTMTVTPTVQRVTVPRGRQTKGQQKIIVQKSQETTTTTPLMNIQAKPSTSVIGNVVKSPQKNQGRGYSKAKQNAQQQQYQKNLLNAALGSITGSPSETSVVSTISQNQIQPPPLSILGTTELPITSEDDGKIDNIVKDSPKIDTPKDSSLETPKTEDNKTPTQPQIMALPTESSDGTQTYVLVTIDEQGQLQPLDNQTLMSLEGTTQNADGTRTLYIDPSSLGDAGAIDNIVLQFDNSAISNIQGSSHQVTETINQNIVTTDNFTSEIIQSSNQDILAAALANTDFQQEIGLPESSTNTIVGGLTQTSLINQTILQSTIIPPTEPISSPAVLETSLTLNQPIMTPLEVPSSLPIQIEPAPASVIATIPTSLELPISDTNISYIGTSDDCEMKIPGNSMPDIGEIIENTTSGQEIPANTQYLVLPNIDENLTIQTQTIETVADANTGSVSYSVSIPDTGIIIDTSTVQKTPSMPLIDDNFVDTNEETFSNANDFPTVTKTENVVEIENSTAHTEVLEKDNEIAKETEENLTPPIEVSTDTIVEQLDVAITEKADIVEDKETEKMEIDAEPSTETIPVSPARDNFSTEIQTEVQSTDSVAKISTDSEDISMVPQDGEPAKEPESLSVTEKSLDDSIVEARPDDCPAQDAIVDEEMPVVEEMEISPTENSTIPEIAQSVETSSQAEAVVEEVDTIERMNDSITEASQEESPSQSYEQFDASNVIIDSIDSPSQSIGKSENSREPSQSIVYETMEIDDNIVSVEPPTQSYDDTKQNEASTSYEANIETNTNAPTQSFNEIIHCQDEGNSTMNTIDDQSFPTQSYEVGKIDNVLENIENDSTVSQEGNIPSQSNDIGNDGIGTSSASTNNLGINEDETASSSYMPETPENQERDQDQESAISTSSYEIPPCEELNIATSSVIPDTSAEVSENIGNIHDNGVPEIPTSSYNLNPDSSSTSHVDGLPTSSYEDQVIVEQNVSTSYEVSISMPGIEENSSQNFVTESNTDNQDQPSSYYAARHPEVTASYYETVQDTNTRHEAADQPQEEATPSYYETSVSQDIGSEASQSYFTPTVRYSDQSGSSTSYYENAPETEASQSFYSQEIEATNEQSSSSTSRNVEASQSFYQETNDNIRLRQQGEATPTYTERYPADYTLANSPIERHDLVESSVPATKPTER